MLVKAASAVIHARGYEGMTLSLVAADAGVPLGNVYYYFRTKDDLTAAVVDARAAEIEQLCTYASGPGVLPPAEQIRRFLGAFESSAERILAHGCPYGTLSQELAKRKGPLSSKAGVLFSLQIEWLSSRFREMGAGERARERAAEVVCAVQGACLLALAMHDADLFRQQLRDIANRLEA